MLEERPHDLEEHSNVLEEHERAVKNVLEEHHPVWGFKILEARRGVLSPPVPPQADSIVLSMFARTG